jgi:nicotinate-nucleotide--dimethylbenzimidazole phosphoribosyltransferase
MDDLATTLAAIRPRDETARALARERVAQLTMPYWALGRLCDLAVDLCGMTGALPPPAVRKAVAVFAGDHGVTAEGVSPSPKEVTPQMVRNFLAGGAGISVFCRQMDARLVVVDVGVDADLSDARAHAAFWDARIANGTGNIARGPAMTRRQAEEALTVGLRVAAALAEGRAGLDAATVSNPPADLLAAGEMGIGNTTPASAITACYTGRPAAEVTGRGCGADDAGLARKIKAIETALAVNRPDPGDPVDVLAKIGGYEIGAIAGFMLGAAARRKPVVLDGFIGSAAALIARGLAPAAADYFIPGHRSEECGHRAIHAALGVTPLLDLGFRLGEGTGAVLAFPLVEAAARMFAEMATFSGAAVTEYIGYGSQ